MEPDVDGGSSNVQTPVHRVALALVHRSDLWLVARRPPHVHLGGLWEFPGGKCEPGETITEAAIRELREECAIEATPERVLFTVVQDYDDRIVHLTPVVCRWTSGEPLAIGSEECRWVSRSDLAALAMPAVNATILRALDGQMTNTPPGFTSPPSID